VLAAEQAKAVPVVVVKEKPGRPALRVGVALLIGLLNCD
jgi:hypothetical protein